MTSRLAIVYCALLQEGQYNGDGYNNPNRYSTDLGLPVEAWCGDFVSWVYWKYGLALPSMQAGHRTGFSYTGDGWAYAASIGATYESYRAQLGDLIIFDWHDGGLEYDHVEMVVGYDAAAGVLHTIGGNSGPANEPGDWFEGNGGVHRHAWPCPSGVGNPDMWGAINTGILVHFGPDNPVHHPPTPATRVPPFPGRTLVLKSPFIQGADVQQWQRQMVARGWSLDVDAVYGPQSRDVCLAFQTQKGLQVDGQVGPQTWTASWALPVTRQ